MFSLQTQTVKTALVGLVATALLAGMLGCRQDRRSSNQEVMEAVREFQRKEAERKAPRQRLAETDRQGAAAVGPQRHRPPAVPERLLLRATPALAGHGDGRSGRDALDSEVVERRASPACIGRPGEGHGHHGPLGVATGAANFFRALFSALVVAVLGAIVLGGLGGVTGMSVEMLARTASAPELAYAFRFVFLACALVLSFGMAFLIAMEERPLRGPSAPSQAATAPTAPATPIPAE